MDREELAGLYSGHHHHHGVVDEDDEEDIDSHDYVGGSDAHSLLAG